MDVLIVGGGPAGSVAAALLARAGVETVLLHQNLPRPPAGEVLLPHAGPLLADLEAEAAVRSLPATQMAAGTSYCRGDGSSGCHYWFEEALAPALPQAYHVRRDEFDALLLARARALGVEVLEGWSAASPIWEGDRLAGVTVREPEGWEDTVRTRTLLDASGQRSFLASRMGWRFPYPRHRKVAVRARYTPAPAAPDGAAGNATVLVSPLGRIAIIPLRDGSAQVDAVLDASASAGLPQPPEQLLTLALAAAPQATRRLGPARLLAPPQGVSDFSYRVTRLAGDGFCLLGDAAGFFDPLFFTGTFLAMAAAACVADDILDALRRHRRVDRNDLAPTVLLTRSLHRLYGAFARSFHDPRFLECFLAGCQRLGARPAMTSLLAGDVLRPGLQRRALRPRLLRLLAKLQPYPQHPAVALDRRPA